MISRGIKRPILKITPVESQMERTRIGLNQQAVGKPRVELKQCDYMLHYTHILQILLQMDHLLTLSLFVLTHTCFHSTQSLFPIPTVMNFPINTTIQWENMQSRLFCCLFPFKLMVAKVCELDMQVSIPFLMDKSLIGWKETVIVAQPINSFICEEKAR